MKAEELIALCKEHKLNAQQRVIKLVAEDFLTMTAVDWQKIFVDLGYDNDPIIRKTKIAFSSLYSILMNKGIATFNPFNSELLSVSSILSVTELNTYITPEELKNKMYLLSNQEYAECFPRLVYEGLYEYRDFYGTKKHDVDFDNKKIYLPNFTITMSDELTRAMLRHSEVTKLSNLFVNYSYDGSFFRTVNTYPDADNIKDFSNVISYYINMIGFKKLHLYGSGFINFLYRELSYSMEKLDELFFDNLEHKGLVEDLVKEIEEYGLQYGIKLEGKLIRYKFKKYYRSFKYKTEKAEDSKAD